MGMWRDGPARARDAIVKEGRILRVGERGMGTNVRRGGGTDGIKISSLLCRVCCSIITLNASSYIDDRGHWLEPQI